MGERGRNNLGRRGRLKVLMRHVRITDLRTGKVFEDAEIIDVKKIEKKDGDIDILIYFRYKYYPKGYEGFQWNYILTSMKNKKIEPNGI